MKLDKKKGLASRALNVGRERIAFNPSRLSEIAEAITRQDFIDLLKNKAIVVKAKKGRRTLLPRKKRGAGKIRKKVNVRKRTYIILTRKLRTYLKEMRNQGKVTKENYLDFRKKIRTRAFKNKAQLQAALQETMKK